MAFTQATLNYATKYQQALAQEFPYVLQFGKLWSATKPEVSFVDCKTVQLPSLTVKGRADGDRDTIGSFSRNFNNSWETKTLKHHRTWQTLVHPKDIIETNQVATIQNITRVMNEEQKFPEMDAYMISTLYDLKYSTTGEVKDTITPANKGSLTVDNVLTKFDDMMDKMDEAGVPSVGRLLYVDTFTKTLIDNARKAVRVNGDTTIVSNVSRIDEVEVISVPTKSMKTAYTFSATDGFSVATTAYDTKMLLVHPSVVIPVVSYEFAQMSEPTAITQGKYVYFEEDFEDVFIYNKKHVGIQFYVEKTTTS